jgi:exopolysaccharide/PEP-CTERM locus tyrosine autokinase
MNKISNAMERRKKEGLLKVKRFPPAPPLDPKRIIQNGFNPKLVTLSAPESIDAENFKVLRAQILFPKNGAVPRTVMVTSAFPGEGKTFVCANLAVSLALGVDEYVLLIDCDLRKPSLHKMFEYPNTEGMHEYLTGKRELPDLIIRTRVEKLSLLTAGSSPSNPAELLSSTMMKEFLEEVKGRYQDRFIIIDAPPSQVTAETNVLASYMDGTIFVVMAQKSPRENIQRSIEQLGKKKILGVVFNGYNKAHKGYHKYYKRYYE